MKKVFVGLLVTILVLILSACGTVVHEVPDVSVDSAELEVQIITSLADSKTIDFLQIAKGEEVVYYEAGLLNRVQSFQLELGEEYTITVKAAIGDASTGRGTATLSRELTLVSTQQKVVLDVRQVVTTDVTYASLEDPLVLSIDLDTKIMRDKGSSDPMTLTSGRFDDRGLFPLDSTKDIFGYGTTSYIEFDDAGRGAVVYSHEGLPEDDILYPFSWFYMGEIILQNADYCATSLGELEFHWENSFSQMTQILTPHKNCKG